MTSGIIREREINCSPLQMHWFEQGANIEACFPSLTAGEREFIKTGITEDEWNALFKEDNDFGDDVDS